MLFASLIGTKIECFDFFARFTPISAVLAERGRRRMLIWVNVALFLFALVPAQMFAAGTTGAVLMMVLA